MFHIQYKDKQLLSILLFSFTLLSPAYADTTEDATEVYTDTGVPAGDHLEKPSGLHGILGVGIFNGQRIIGDDGRRTALFPLVLMRYKDIAYWSIGGGGVWLLQAEDRSLRFGAGIRLAGGWRPDDDPDLFGMHRRNSSIDGYVNGVWRTRPVTIGARYYHDIGDASHSGMASLRLSHNFRIADGFRITPSIGATWLDSGRVDYYYGVRPDEALPFRPVYTGRETVNVNAGMTGAYRLVRSWSLLGGVFATRVGNGIVDSPIVVRRWSTLVFFGAGWMF